MYQLPKPSQEQQLILDLVKKGHNVVVEALAGAGKTTMLLQTMLQNPEKSGFMVSYNRGLVDETNLILTALEKTYKINIRSRMVIVTYHSLLSMLINKVIDDDLLFLWALAETDFSEKRKNWKFAHFDFIIIDEGQDMRDSFFRLIMNLIVQCCIHPEKVQIIAVGDEIQLLYDFYAINRADSRFLTCMDQLFKDISKREWKKAVLSRSYRSTEPMANFINSLFKTRITIPKPATLLERTNEKPVQIFVLDLYKDSPNIILPEVLKSQTKKESVLILCSSLNERSPAVGIVDLLVANNLSVHVARSGNLSDGGSSHIKQSTTQNKILLKTKHGAKGIEAEKVFDLIQDNIFDYYKNPIKNKEYVGLTRASKELFVLLDYRNITKYQLEKYIKDNLQLKQKDVKITVLRDIKDGNPKDDLIDMEDTTKQKEQTNFTSNTLFSFIDVTHLQALLNMLHITVLQPPLTTLAQPTPSEEEEMKTKQMEGYFHQMNITYDQGLTYINVTNICGIALTMALEYTVTKCTPITIHKMYSVCLSKQQSDDKYRNLRKQLELVIQELRTSTTINIDPVTDTLNRFKTFAKMGALFDAFSGYCEKLNSLKNYDFINKPAIFERYRALFGSLTLILSKHNMKINDLIWYREEIGRFKYDDKSITINVKPTIISKCGSLLIDIIHAPSIGHEHHLSALVAAQIAGDARTSVYVLNIGDGSIEYSKLHLIENKNIPITTTTSQRSEDIETIMEAQTLINKPSYSESMNFISAAITFKLCKDENPNNENFIGTYHKLVKTSISQRKTQELNLKKLFH